MRHIQPPAYILRKHRRRQPIHRIISLLEHILLILKLNHHPNRAKDLLLHDLHGRLGVGEDGRLDPVAFFAVAGAAEVNGGAFGFAGVDVGHDALWDEANK